MEALLLIYFLFLIPLGVFLICVGILLALTKPGKSGVILLILGVLIIIPILVVQ